MNRKRIAMAREIAINKIAVNAAMLVAGFGMGYWYAMKTAYEVVREALSR